MIETLSSLQLGLVAASALLIGFSKTSAGGVGILSVLLVALAFPGKASPGILLPMIVMADIFAVIYYRRACNWSILVRILPMTAVGIFVGYLLVDIMPHEGFEKAIGAIIVVMLLLDLLLARQRLTIKEDGIWTYPVGIVAGILTMIANAAGPVFAVYLLNMRLTKESFVGTRSWYFLLLNIFKVPFSVNLGLITTETLKLNLMMLPVIFSGAWLGHKILKLINLVVFRWIIRLSALIVVVRLLIF